MPPVAEGHVFFTILLVVLAPGYAQSGDGEKVRVPKCFADCLFRDLPSSGQWATYNLNLYGEKRGKAQPEKTLTVRSAMIPAKGSRELESVEVSIRDDKDKPPIYVAKLLVKRNEEATDKNEWWFMSQKQVLGWEKRQDEITRFTAESFDNSAILASFIGYGQSETEWLEQPAVDVKTKAGTFRCKGFQWRPKMADQPRVSCRLHPKIPFGCVSFSFQLNFGDKRLRAHVQLVSHGKDAKSDLPDWDLIGLRDDAAKRTGKQP